MLCCRRHSQAKQILNGITQDDQRCEDNRDGTPPSQRQIDQQVFPEHRMNARFAKLPLRRFRQAKEKKPNVSIEIDSSCRSFCTTSLTGHGHDLPQMRSVKRTGFIAFRWEPTVSPSSRKSQTRCIRFHDLLVIVFRLPKSSCLSTCFSHDNKWNKATLQKAACVYAS